MNFTLSSSLLLTHLVQLGRVVNPKNQLSILENFLLKIEDGKLTVTASDLETTMITTIPLESATGNITLAVNAKLLIESLKEFSEQPLYFEVNEENLAVVLRTQNGNYNFVGLCGDEFPVLPKVGDDASQFTMPVDVLLSAITRCSFATADDEIRPAMTGIFFDIKPEDITFVATDAHKLVRYKSMLVKSGFESSFILPKKPAALLKGVLAKEEGEVQVQFDVKNAIFTLANYTMYCRQIEGRFPNYNGVIPQNNTLRLTIDRLSMLNAVKRVFAFSNQGTGLVKLSIENNSLTISAQDIDFSTSAIEQLECNYDGEPIAIGFKAPFLIDILNNINGNDVVMALAEPSRAGLVMPSENDDDEDLLMLIMPMMLQE